MGDEDVGVTQYMVHRKREHETARRSQAVVWVRSQVGVSWPPEPTDEEFCAPLRTGAVLCRLLNELEPGTVPKIVDGGEHVPMAYQAMENVDSFLKAVQKLCPSLPLFSATDLEKRGDHRATTKVVDTLLALKSFYDWRAAGQEEECWSPTRSLRKGWQGPDSASSPVTSSSSSSHTVHSQENEITYFDEGREKGQETEQEKRAKLDRAQTNGSFMLQLSSLLREKVDEHLNSPKGTPTASLSSSGLQSSDTGETPRSALTDLVRNVIRPGIPPESLGPMVEMMLGTVMQEFERRLFLKEQKVNKMKESLMDVLKREDRLASRGKVLEALANGSSEEVQVVSKQLHMLQGERGREVQSLKDALLASQAEADELKERVEKLSETDPAEVTYLKKRNKEMTKALKKAMHVIRDLRRQMDSIRSETHKAGTAYKKQVKEIGSSLFGVTKVLDSVGKIMAENRRLYNELQELRGNIRVYCRVRPMHQAEKAKPSCVEFVGENGDVLVAQAGRPNTRKTFTFDKAFGPAVKQEQVFEDTKPLIRSVLDGFNVCIFAYGQTGSGKTHTMSGPPSASEEQWGVNYRALSDLFSIGRLRADHVKYDVAVQMIEIYNEQVRDLLAESVTDKKKKLEIRIGSSSDGSVPDALKVSVSSTQDVLDLMSYGTKNRAVGSTAMNANSSRSHSILTVHVMGTEKHSGGVLRGCLHLVDLAGSERLDRSEATGERLKEAQHINKSLSALGDVISALAAKTAHVPYRNSKLTHILQEALGKQAKTLMFVHVSPDEESYNESLSTLRFAERVSSVELGQSKKSAESSELREARELILTLKDELNQKSLDLERLHAQKDHPSTPRGANARRPSGGPDPQAKPRDPTKARRGSEEQTIKSPVTPRSQIPETSSRLALSLSRLSLIKRPFTPRESPEPSRSSSPQAISEPEPELSRLPSPPLTGSKRARKDPLRESIEDLNSQYQGLEEVAPLEDLKRGQAGARRLMKENKEETPLLFSAGYSPEKGKSRASRTSLGRSQLPRAPSSVSGRKSIGSAIPQPPKASRQRMSLAGTEAYLEPQTVVQYEQKRASLSVAGSSKVKPAWASTSSGAGIGVSKSGKRWV